MIMGGFRTSRHAPLLAAFLNRISLVGPVRPEIVGQIEDLHISKPHIPQFRERGSEIRAVIPRTAPTIKHNQLLSWKGVHSILQLLEPSRLRTLPYVFGSWDVTLGIHHVRADLQDQRLFRAGSQHRMAQRLGHEQLGLWN